MSIRGVPIGAKRELRTANVPEFPVLEDEEVLPLGDLLEAFDRPIGEVVDDVCMCLEHAYRVADFLGQAKEGGGVMDVGGDAEVGLLDGDEGQEVAGQCWQRFRLCSHREGLRATRVPFRWHCEVILWLRIGSMGFPSSGSCDPADFLSNAFGMPKTTLARSSAPK